MLIAAVATPEKALDSGADRNIYDAIHSGDGTPHFIDERLQNRAPSSVQIPRWANAVTVGKRKISNGGRRSNGAGCGLRVYGQQLQTSAADGLPGSCS